MESTVRILNTVVDLQYASKYSGKKILMNQKQILRITQTMAEFLIYLAIC